MLHRNIMASESMKRIAGRLYANNSEGSSIMRTYRIIAAIAASLTATIGLAAEPEQRFVHDGRTYVYHTVEADGAKVISGRQLPDGSPFRLVVRHGRVTGTAGSTPVSFRTREARGATGGIAGTSN
jgi:hypothetical protein